MTDLVGQKLGKYELQDHLGRGSMAHVYRAWHPVLNRAVALKVLHAHLVDPHDETRFRREARAIANLRHPNIIQVHDFDVQDGRCYLVLEYVAGPTLAERLQDLSQRGERMPVVEQQNLFRGLCSALTHAHAQGIVHRDLKPANVLLTPGGQPVLTDLSIARMMADSFLTAEGTTLGTPTYMSPEQGQGQHGDTRSDLYSLGVILYQVATGQVPFQADNPYATIMKHVHSPLLPPSAVDPAVSPALERVIVKALEKDPARRYQTAADLWADLEPALTPAPSARRRRTRLLVWASLVLAVLLASTCLCARLWGMTRRVNFFLQRTPVSQVIPRSSLQTLAWDLGGDPAPW